MQNQENRRTYIDLVKCVAIGLVVLGHVISGIYDTETFNENILFKIAYSVHMPLFNYISGYLASLSLNINKVNSKEWIKKRTLGLIIPYIIWTGIECFLANDPEIFHRLLVHPFYWFLINVWIYHLITWIFMYFKKPLVFKGAAYLVFIIVYIVLKDDNLVIKNMVMFYPFYLLGTLIGEHKKIEDKFIRIEPISLLIYPLSMFMFSYKSYNILVPRLVNQMGGYFRLQ